MRVSGLWQASKCAGRGETSRDVEEGNECRRGEQIWDRQYVYDVLYRHLRVQNTQVRYRGDDTA